MIFTIQYNQILILQQSKDVLERLDTPGCTTGT